jgi:carboxypeptidase C (cathepsin A)
MVEGAGPARPLTFVFNGGPGAASAYLHLAALGPKVVAFAKDAASAVAPAIAADNPDTWLAFTDLVFVDPVATGYSRAVGGEEGEKAYTGVEKDADAAAEVVRLYLARNGRTLAPVFLAGESYGGFRVALLAQRLLKGGFAVKGVTMISPALEFSTLWGGRFTLWADVLALPSIAASHMEEVRQKPISAETAKTLQTFALGPYLQHLTHPGDDDAAVAQALADLTGLAPDIIGRNRARVGVSLYARELERARDRSLSRYDGTVSIATARPAGSHDHIDPILDRATTVLAPAFESYARNELGLKTDLDYRLLNRDLHWDWGTSPQHQGFAGALDELEEARVLNSDLGIFIAHGFTDLVTPFTASKFLADQLRPIEGARAPTLKLYPGGHMMYLRSPSRQALAIDVAAFYGGLIKDR